MDQEGDNILKDEYCYFDGKERRLKKFVTLTASLYHPLLRKQVVLASMDCEKEDTENVTLFWNTFNSLLRKESSDLTYSFNPKGWCSDAAGCNAASIESVFGKEALSKLKSCEFHFLDCRNRQANKLPNDKEKFKALLVQALLDATSTDAYFTAKHASDDFIAEDLSLHGFLYNWLKFWHERREFLFRAFRKDKDAP